MKFEVGKRYNEDGGVCYEIVRRTAKRITYVQVQHAGRYNECKSEPKTVAIKAWQKGEVFFTTYGSEVTSY